MTGGRGLEAVETKRQYVRCTGCGGEGWIEWSNGELTIAGFRHSEIEQCDLCGGSGEEYVGPSGEPEDYVENDDDQA